MITSPKIGYCRLCDAEINHFNIDTLNAVPSIAQHFTKNKNVALKQKIDLYFYTCDFCNHTQLLNYPVKYFKECIRSADISNDTLRYREQQISKFSKRYAVTDANSVEIGCGNFEISAILTRYFTEVHSIDYKKQRGTVPDGIVYDDYYLGDNLPSHHLEKFKTFFCFNFLEHNPYPRVFLRNLRQILSNNSVGIIEVPNYDFITVNNKVNEVTIEHLNYFNKSTLGKILELSGFKILSIKEIFNNYVLSAEVESQSNVSKLNLETYTATLNKTFNAILGQYSIKNLGVWGVGHQAMTTVSLLERKSKIKYLFDSSPSKQNYIAPNSNIQILDPQYIKHKNVDAILLLAGGYNNEIKTLISKYFQCVNHLIMESQGSFIRYPNKKVSTCQ